MSSATRMFSESEWPHLADGCFSCFPVRQVAAVTGYRLAPGAGR